MYMDGWTLHWLEASGPLANFRPALNRGVAHAYQAIAELMPPPRLDILVQNLPGESIAEIGMGGYAYRSNLFALSIDPGNPNLLSSLHGGGVARIVLHEVHHCLRMAGPGYGWTLGEAMVSEGLAGHFARHLLGGSPEPWELAMADSELRAEQVSRHGLESSPYDHGEWFFGLGIRPRWLGYSLGYRMVGLWLAAQGSVDAATWVGVPAEEIISVAVEAGLVLD